jgi:SET domain-containing protein
MDSTAQPDPLLLPPDGIEARRSPLHGDGIYARNPISRDTRVIEYTGELITKAESEKREEERRARQKAGGDGCVYIFDLGPDHDLDGRAGGGLARLINHSCAPNCRAEIIEGRIWIVALRNIEAGEELTFDYGFPYKEWPLHPCRCGARRCAGFIVNAGQRWRVRKILRGRRGRNSAGDRLNSTEIPALSIRSS